MNYVVAILLSLFIGNVGLVNAETATILYGVGARGTIGDHGVTLHVVIASKPGGDPATVAEKAIDALQTLGFSMSEDVQLLGVVFPQFFDRRRDNDVVTLFYSPRDEAFPAGAEALKAAMAPWNAIKHTPFRFAFGGTSERCPSLSGLCPELDGPDGFNDIGWRPISPELDPVNQLVGYTAMHIDQLTGTVTEADIVLNSEARAWTDGVDVQSILLHELGHVAGLQHTNSLDAVMSGFQPPVMHELTQTDIDGLRFAYPQHPSALTAQPSRDDFQLVAERGAPAPGGDVFRNHFEPGAINQHGEVAFVTDVASGQALFLHRDQQAVQVARSGQRADNILLGLGTIFYTAINKAGDVAFSWALEPFVPSPFGANAALFRADKGGAVQALVVPGITPAPGGGVFHGSSDAAISDNGDIAFAGLVDGTLGPDFGVFLVRRNGVIVAITRPGAPAPGGGTFVRAFRASIGNGGDVAFNADVSGVFGQGVYVYRVRTGQVEKVAGGGDRLPDGTLILNTFLPLVNRQGHVLFAGRIGAPAPFPPGWGLFLAADGMIRTVARFGDRMPDGVQFETLLLPSPRAFSLNDNGDVAFAASTLNIADDLPFLSISRNEAIYATTGGRLRSIVRLDVAMFGAGKPREVTPNSSGVQMNDLGEVLFVMRTEANRLLLLKAGPDVFTP